MIHRRKPFTIRTYYIVGLEQNLKSLSSYGRHSCIESARPQTFINCHTQMTSVSRGKKKQVLSVLIIRIDHLLGHTLALPVHHGGHIQKIQVHLHTCSFRNLFSVFTAICILSSLKFILYLAGAGAEILEPFPYSQSLQRGISSSRL